MAEDIKYGILVKMRDEVSGALGKLQSNLKDFHKKVEEASRIARTGLLAVAGGVGAIVYEAAQHEEASRKLSSALETVGEKGGDAFKSLSDLADKIQDTTVYSSEAAMDIMAYAVNLGVTKDNMEEVVDGAIGLSEVLGMDLQSALRAVVAAEHGQFTMLERQLPALRDAKTDAEKLAVVQDLMARGFKQATDKGDTLVGKITQLKNIFGDLLAAIGQTIFKTSDWGGTLDALKDKIKGAIEWVQNLTKEQKENIITLLKWGVGFLFIVAVLGPLSSALSGFVGLIAAVTSPVGSVALAVALLGGTLLVLTDVLGWTNIGLENLARSILPLDMALTGAQIAFALAADEIKGTFSDLVTGIREDVANILELGKKLYGFIPGLTPLAKLGGVDFDKWIGELRMQISEAKEARAKAWFETEWHLGDLRAALEKRHPGHGFEPKPLIPHPTAAAEPPGAPGPAAGDTEKARAELDRLTQAASPFAAGAFGPVGQTAAALAAAKKAAEEAQGVPQALKDYTDESINLMVQLMDDQKVTKDQLQQLQKMVHRLATAR